MLHHKYIVGQQAGGVQGSLQFDGVDEGGIGTITTAVATDNFSVAAWVKAPAQDTKDIIDQFSTNPGFGLWAVATGKAAGTGTDKSVFTVSSDGGSGNRRQIQTSVTVFDDTWHHIVWTFASGTVKAYVDGVEDTGLTNFSSSGTVNSIHSANTNLALARLTNPAAAFLNGNIYSISLWDTQVLGATEASALYNNGRPRLDNQIPVSGSQNCVHYWRMGNSLDDDISNNQVTDQVGSVNFALSNMESSDFIIGEYPK